MSVTITINNNSSYCLNNNLVEQEKVECFCDFKGCELCNNSGYQTINHFPYSLNLCNKNFSNLWKGLGLVSTPCGFIDARTLEKQLHSTKIPNKHYVSMLQELVNQAEKREEMIVWH